MKVKDKNCRMLLVSDDACHHVAQALTDLDVDVWIAPDPKRGLAGLDDQLSAHDDSLPHVILLDVQDHDHTLLRGFKRHSPLGLVPVLVFLSEKTEARVKDLYAAGASLVFLKPAGFSNLRNALQRLVSLWCEFVTPPPVPRPL